MEEIIIDSAVTDKLDLLLNALIEKGYFTYRENAKAYADNIYDFILSIHSLKKKRTKKSTHGYCYCSYKPNRNTTYYIHSITKTIFIS